MPLKITVISGTSRPHGHKCECFVCPLCGAPEVDDCTKPVAEWRFQLRMSKVQTEDGIWHSHCTVCDKWFNSEEAR